MTTRKCAFCGRFLDSTEGGHKTEDKCVKQRQAEQKAWTRFMAVAIQVNDYTQMTAAEIADVALEQWQERFNNRKENP